VSFVHVESNKEPVNASDQSPPGSLVVSLTVSRTRVSYGGSIDITATLVGGEPSSYDWIGLYQHGVQAKNDAQLTYGYYKPGAPVNLQCPSYGVFEARYLRKVNGVLQSLTISGPVLCGPAMTLRTSISGDNWLVHHEWDKESEQVMPKHSWIGLYRKGADNSNYLAFQYLSVANGVLSFVGRLTNGEFEFRFFPYKFQGPTSVSEVLVVNRQDSVVWEKHGEQCTVKSMLVTQDPSVNTRIWVAVCFANNDEPNQWRRFAYITEPSQTHMFKAPIHTGMYVARIYDGNNKNKLLATSNGIQIDGV